MGNSSGTPTSRPGLVPPDADANDRGAGHQARRGGPEIVVDLDAIAHNVRILTEHAGDAAVMVVVKADGYNHGAIEVGKAALAAGARELGVTTIAEAVALRESGIDAPILCWLNNSDADFGSAIAADIEIAVPSVAHLEGVAAAVDRLGRPAIVSVKVDTGLNRNGVPEAEYPRL